MADQSEEVEMLAPDDDDDEVGFGIVRVRGGDDDGQVEDMWTHPSFQLYTLHPKNNVRKNRKKTAFLFFVVGGFFAACLAFFYSQEKRTTITQDVDKVVARPFTLDGVDVTCQPLMEFNRAIEDSPLLHGIRGTLQVAGKFASEDECKAAAKATILQNLRWNYDSTVPCTHQATDCTRDKDSACLNRFGCSITDFPRGQSCFALKATTPPGSLSDDSTLRPYLYYQNVFRRGEMPAETWWEAMQAIMAPLDPTLPYMKDWTWGSSQTKQSVLNGWAEWEHFKAFLAANQTYTMATYFGEGDLTEACRHRDGSLDARCGDIYFTFGAYMPHFSDRGELLGFNASGGSSLSIRSKSWQGGLDTSVPHPNLPQLLSSGKNFLSYRINYGSCVAPFFDLETMTWLNETFQMPTPPFIAQMRALSHTLTHGLLEEEICAKFKEHVSPFQCTYKQATVVIDSKSFWESVSLSLSASSSVFTVVVFLIHKFWH